MNANTLTGAHAKQAREHIGISLLSVSKITGINRNDLTKFEQEKGVLSAEHKQTLIEFYKERGYQFADSENILADHQTVKAEQLNEIKQQFGSELATIIEVVLQDSEEKIEWLNSMVEDYQQANEKPSTPTMDKAFSELEIELLKHFEADKAGKITIEKSFFGGEDTENRSSKLAAMCALQYLRILAANNPEFITLSQTESKEDTDNARLLTLLGNCFDFEELKEFKHVTSDAVK